MRLKGQQLPCDAVAMKTNNIRIIFWETVDSYVAAASNDLNFIAQLYRLCIEMTDWLQIWCPFYTQPVSTLFHKGLFSEMLHYGTEIR